MEDWMEDRMEDGMDFQEGDLLPGPADLDAAAAISKAAKAWLSSLDATEEGGDRLLRPKRPDLTVHADASGIRAFVQAAVVAGPPSGASNLEALDAATRLRTAEERADTAASAANAILSSSPGIPLERKDRLQIHFESGFPGRFDRGSAALCLRNVWTAAPVLDFGRRIDSDALSRALAFARRFDDPLDVSSSGDLWRPKDWRVVLDRPLDPQSSFCGFSTLPEAGCAARQVVWSSLFDGWVRRGRINGLDARVRPATRFDADEPWIFSGTDLRRSLQDEAGAAAAMARIALDRFEEDRAAGERGETIVAARSHPRARRNPRAA